MATKGKPKKSPFTNWIGRLGHLKGRRSDDLVKELRGPRQKPQDRQKGRGPLLPPRLNLGFL